MRKVVLTMSVSLDGYMEGPGRDIGWHVVGEELLRHFNAWLGQAGAFLEGRVTYQLMADYWPTADRDPAAPAAVAEFARIWRDMPKIVYSRTLTSAGWNTTIARGVIPEEIMRLKAQPGGDLVVGGADLAAAFLRHDLIDEIRIYVHPIVLGQGKPLFQPSDARLPLRLEETCTFSGGVVLLRYAREPRTI